MNSTSTRNLLPSTGWSKIFMSRKKRRIKSHYEVILNMMMHYDKQATELTIDLSQGNITREGHHNKSMMVGSKLHSLRKRAKTILAFSSI